MCTIGLLLGQSSRYPLIVAANRDESAERPSREPFVWTTPTRLVAGRDEVAGGTWLGVNQHGLVVAITNLWTGRPPDPTRASRGALVTEMLTCRDPGEAGERLLQRNPTSTNPYILVCADATGHAWWSTNARGERVRLVEMGPGAHAIGNLVPHEGVSAKLHGTAAAFARVDSAADDPALLGDLGQVLATHRGDRGPRDSVCVHTDSGYGTVSATVLLLAGQEGRLFHATGPPCVTPLEDRSPLLTELFAVA